MAASKGGSLHLWVFSGPITSHSSFSYNKSISFFKYCTYWNTKCFNFLKETDLLECSVIWIPFFKPLSRFPGWIGHLQWQCYLGRLWVEAAFWLLKAAFSHVSQIYSCFNTLLFDAKKSCLLNKIFASISKCCSLKYVKFILVYISFQMCNIIRHDMIM